MLEHKIFRINTLEFAFLKIGYYVCFMGNIKGIIKSHDLKIQDVAKEIGISIETMANWDEHKTYPTVTQFDKLATAVGEEFCDMFYKVYK